MSQTSNPHRGFDFATTVEGESVPTRFERDLARELKSLSHVHVVGWSGTHASMTVTTDDLLDTVKAVAENVEDRETDVELESDEGVHSEYDLTVEFKR